MRRSTSTANRPKKQPWRTQGWDTEGIRNNFIACIRNYASWGYFDFRQQEEPYEEGFQSVPVHWEISTGRKRNFFNLAKQITDGDLTS